MTDPDMTVQTPLDRAHDAMQADPAQDAPRLQFYDTLADSELFLMLEREVADDRIAPQVFDVADGRFVLAFDTEERLAAFAGQTVPFAALSGRIIAQLLSASGEGIGLGLNLEVAPSAILLPPAALLWLSETIESRPDEVEALPERLTPPGALPQGLLEALASKLARAGGLASHALLAAAHYPNETAPRHLLAFIDAEEGTRAALAKATAEALTFSGVEAGSLEVAFFAPSDAVTAQLENVALRLDMPGAPVAETPGPAAPGRDPAKPPRLR